MIRRHGLFLRRRLGMMAVAAGCVCTASTTWADDAVGLDPEAGGIVRSLGLPSRWHPSISAMAGGAFGEPGTTHTGEARLRLYRDLFMAPAAGIQASLDGGIGWRDGDLTAGGRFMLTSHPLRFALGVDWEPVGPKYGYDFSPVVSVLHPVRRGGILAAGSMLRLDYLPLRGHSVMLGLELPILRLFAVGESRPATDEVSLPEKPDKRVLKGPPNESLRRILDQARTSAKWVYQLTVPAMDADNGDADAFVAELSAIQKRVGQLCPCEPGTSAPEKEVRRFHALLDQAFTLALSLDPEHAVGASRRARFIAAKARETLLDGVLLPYNRLLGQFKDEDTVLGLGAQSLGRFLHWTASELAVDSRKQIAALAWVYGELVHIVESVREQALRDWGDPRLIWLPLQLALLPEDHDSAEELSSLIEKAVETRFAKNNRVWYVVNERFPMELARTIEETEFYHVLWIHDIRGLNEEGEPDEVAFAFMVESYLATLAERVEAYDESGKLPIYMIFIDQWYLDVNQGRLWLEVLEDPLHKQPSLPEGYESWHKKLEAVQERLQRAVSSSALLQAGARLYGESWLRNRIKVHVSVTNQADPSFWSPVVVPLIGMTDDVMRDHRKLAFHDVSEQDPYKGFAIYTGMGVGEHYLGAQWNDRGILATGPALLSLKENARELLLSQGIEPDEIPWPLKPQPLADDWKEKIDAAASVSEYDTRAMELHNGTGYAAKPVNVLKALLYTLQPPGALIIAPDSLWNNFLWGAMLTGHTLRGGTAMVIAPALQNAPSAGFPQMSRARDLLTRLIYSSERLNEELSEVGGRLSVGLYAPDTGVFDLPARLRNMVENYRRYPMLEEIAPFHPSVLAVLDAGAERAEDALAQELAEHRAGAAAPFLHMKVNAFVLEGLWKALVVQPEWAPLFSLLIDKRIENLLELTSIETLRDVPDLRELPRKYASRAEPLLDQLRLKLSVVDPQQIGVWLEVGSHNQNYRSMLMDGEVTFVTTGAGSFEGLFDLVFVALECDWITSLEQLDELLPPYSGWKRWLARWLKTAV